MLYEAPSGELGHVVESGFADSGCLYLASPFAGLTVSMMFGISRTWSAALMR